MRVTKDKPRDEAPPPKGHKRKPSKEEEIERLKKELEETKKQLSKQPLDEEGFPLVDGEPLQFPRTIKKIIAAIRSERLLQDTEKPIISMRRLRNHYKVASDFIYKAVPYLIHLGLIARKEARLNGHKTYQWELFDEKLDKPVTH